MTPSYQVMSQHEALERIRLYTKELRLPALTHVVRDAQTDQWTYEEFKVRFYSAPVLASELVEAQESHSLTKLHKQLLKLDLLILDDLSYLSFLSNNQNCCSK